MTYAPHRREAATSRVGQVPSAERVSARRCAATARPRLPSRVSRLGSAIRSAAPHSWAATSRGPQKRRIILSNASHVLGLPAGDRRVRHLARRIYGTYARFVIELMRLPSACPPTSRCASCAPARRPRWRLVHRAVRATAGRGPRPDRGFGAHRQHRPARGRLRAARAADIRRGRRLGLSRAARGDERAAAALGHRGHPVAQHAPRIQGTARAGDRRAWSSTGATAPTMSRSGCSASGPRCPPARQCWPPRTGAAIVPVVCRRLDDGTYEASPLRPDRGRGHQPGRNAARNAAGGRRDRGHDRRPRPSSGTSSSRSGRRRRPRRTRWRPGSTRWPTRA